MPLKDETYCDKDMSLKLKGLGFDEHCSYYYVRDVRVKDDMYNKFPGFHYNDYLEYTKEFGGEYEWEDVFEVYYDRIQSRRRNGLLDGEIGEICTCPTLDQVVNWFATVWCISISPKPYVCEGSVKWLVEIRTFTDATVELEHTINLLESYNDALTQGIEYVMEYVCVHNNHI